MKLCYICCIYAICVSIHILHIFIYNTKHKYVYVLYNFVWEQKNLHNAIIICFLDVFALISKVFQKSFHMVTYIFAPFFKIIADYSIIWMCHNLANQSPVDEYL